MRIEAYTHVQQIYKTSTAKAGNARKSSASADQLELSSVGQDYRAAKQAVEAAPDVRESITAPLKKSISTGTYQVSNESFANKLLEKYELNKEEMR